MCEIKKLNNLKRRSLDLVHCFKRENPLSLLRKTDVSINGLTYSDFTEKMDSVSSCASIVELKSDWKKTDDGLEQVMKVAAANYCKQHAVCPVCANRSQARRRARYDSSIRNQVKKVSCTKERMRGKVFDERDKDNRYAYLMTYTVTDGPDLGERLKHLKESKRAFRRQGQRRKSGRSCGEAGKIVAAISTIEVKRGAESGLWHIHAHDLVFSSMPLDYHVYNQDRRHELREQYGDNIPHEKLVEIANNLVDFRGGRVPASKISMEWLRATGGDSMGLSVEPIRHIPKNCSGKKRRMYRKFSFEDSVAYQAREALKYIYKPGENTPWDFMTIIDATYNKRMTGTYGEFRGIGGDDYDDPAADDQETFVLVWNDDTHKYDDPQPGKLRDMIEDEEATKARSRCGKITGEYRRQRRSLLDAREKAGESLSLLLDGAKRIYRAQIRGVWSLYRQAVDTAKRIDSGKCDKYSVTLSLSGGWIPGSDRRDLYIAAFS